MTLTRRTRPLAALAAAALAAPALAGFDSDKVALHAQLPLSMFGSNFAEDCWGYVSESGREYAIIGLSRGTGFVEITDPDNPVIVEVINTPNRGRDMKVYQDYVYSTSDSGPLHVIDVSDIDNGNVTLVDSLDAGAHNLNVNADSATLYLAIGGPLVALDISNPASPQFAGLLDIESHDVQVVSYTEGEYAGREIAFISAGREDALVIADVTDKDNMFEISREGYPGARYAHQGWLSGDRQYFYMGDELDGVNRTEIFDVSDLNDPVHLGFYDYGTQSTDHNLYWKEGFIFEADYTSGLRVVDACDPVNPVQTGYFDTLPGSDGDEYDGAWSNYPYFPSGTVIVSDRSNGLFVLNPAEAIGDGCPGDCVGDLDKSGDVGFPDLLRLLAAWGDCPGGCPEDLDGDEDVDFQDVLRLLAAWGPC